MAKKNIFEKYLLVEGKDDQHVVWALAERYSLPENFLVIDCGGIDPLLERMPVQLKASGLKVLGIIVDADVNLLGRWQSLRSLLLPTFPHLPGVIPPTGLILNNEDGLRIGVWIMPDNGTEGLLEDFLRFLIPPNDLVIGPVDALLADLEERGIQGYGVGHRSKARLHTWLGLQEDPGTPLGQSITKRYLQLEDDMAYRFRDWIRTLFTD